MLPAGIRRTCQMRQGFDAILLVQEVARLPGLGDRCNPRLAWGESLCRNAYRLSLHERPDIVVIDFVTRENGMSFEERSDRHLDEASVRRRIEFVIQEARRGMRLKDHVIGRAIRAASNYYCIGRDGSSYRVKRMCKLVMARRTPGPQWRSQTLELRNNHSWQPIQSVWQYIIENKESITPEEVVELLKKHPFVIVTKEEDARLRGVKGGGRPKSVTSGPESKS